jgi:hypothetical protein
MRDRGASAQATRESDEQQRAKQAPFHEIKLRLPTTER